MGSIRMVLLAGLLCGAVLLTLFPLGCVGSGAPNNGGNTSGRASDARRRFPLDQFTTATITANDQNIRVWLADDNERRTEGLMFVPAEELPDDQGMLFVFDEEDYLGFWMLNTISPLDIAYARADGTIVKIWQMPALTIQTFPSIEPAMFALEMRAGAFAKLGLKEGDTLIIPAEVLKP